MLIECHWCDFVPPYGDTDMGQYFNFQFQITLLSPNIHFPQYTCTPKDYINTYINNSVNLSIGSCNGLLPYSTKPLPRPLLSYHQ